MVEVGNGACTLRLPFDYGLVICFIVSQESLRGDEAQAKFDAFVRQLDSPWFYQRVSAAEELLRLVAQQWGGANSEVAIALRRGLLHQSLNLRVAAQR